MEPNLPADNFTSSQESQVSKFGFNPKKIIRWASIFLIVGIMFVGIIISLKDKKISVVPVAQAKELFTLYFDIDHIREESAKLFAELFEASQYSERIGGQTDIGKKPPLRDPKTLIELMEANRIGVNEALNSINEKSFSDSEVSKKHQEVRAFYTQVAQFEDKVIGKLSGIQDDKDFPKVIDDIFELEPDWDNLLSSDRKLRSSLKDLASSYGISFNPEQYDEIFRKTLVNLGTNVVSKESKGFNEYGEAIYPFSVKETTTIQAVVSVSSAIPFDKNTKFSFVHPDGRRIAIPFVTPKESVLFEKEYKSYGDKCGETCAVFKLFPQDANVSPIAGKWQFVVLTKIGNNLVFGFTEF